MKNPVKKLMKRSLKERRAEELMKTVREVLSRPARRVGRLQSPTRTPKAHVSPKATRRKAVAPKAAQATDPVRYDNGQHYDTGLRYQVTDPAPVPGMARVKLGLATLSVADLVGFGHSHDEAITANPYFPTPQPTPAVFDAKLAELEAILAELENHRILGKNLTAQRDAIRAEFEQVFTLRGNYVELTSQGDADWIASAGLPVKNAPTPTGILPPPLGLRADRTQLDGELVIRWNPVVGAKGGYLLEMAEVVDNVAVGWKIQYMGGKYSTLQSGLEGGKTYAFRVAAVGGEGGKSAFSPEVWRAVA